MQRLGKISAAMSIIAIVLLICGEGYVVLGSFWRKAAFGVTALAILVSTTFHVNLARRSLQPLMRLKRLLPDTVLLLGVLGSWLAGASGIFAVLAFVHQLLSFLRWATLTPRGKRLAQHLLARPAQMLTTSFVILIALGTVFLTFPRATTDGYGASIVDAAFTATSATCVTGLAVLNTNDDPSHNPRLQSFSRFGQLVIFLLIQIGGLGIMTLSAAILLVLGRQLGFRSQAVLQDIMEESSRLDLENSIRFIFKTTLIVELLGALVLYQRFQPALGDEWTAMAYALFTSVSAYCNAGFSLWSDSLMGFREDGWVMSTIMVLISLGGLGFTVLAAVTDKSVAKHGIVNAWRRWPVHVRIVLTMSLWLVVIGTILFYYLDFHYSLNSGMSRTDRWLAALFQSVTMRTAGFSTVDLGQISRITMVCMLLLMMVGGSSGSTAGGIKTSTVAVVFLSVRAMIAGREDVEVYGRTVPKAIVYKSLSILVIFLGAYFLGLVALMAAEPALPFDTLVFETMSALATVGLSMGVTPELGSAGKLVVIVLMFIGRVGPLTLALAVGAKERRVAMRYPEDRVLVG